MADNNAVADLLDTANWEALTYVVAIAFHIAATETSGSPSPIIDDPRLAALIEVARRRHRQMPQAADEDYSDPPSWLTDLWK